MRQVWKFNLSPGTATEVAAGDVVHVAFQRGAVCAWVLVDPLNEGKQVLEVFGTGWTLDERWLVL